MKVSIIVPVFNSAGSIAGCCDSLLAQTMDEIELIFVDDHGTDGSMAQVEKVAGDYIGKKKFIFARTPENLGAGSARNAGIRCATGEYIAFVDSDDTIDPSFCEKLYAKAVSTGADMVCCDISINSDIRRNPPVGDRRLFLKRYVSYFTTFIYRREMILQNDILFPATRSAEDTCFLTCSILCAGKMEQINEPMYFYIRHEDSTSRKRNRSRAFQRLSSFSALMDFAKSRGLYEEYRSELISLYIKKGLGVALKDIVFG